MRTPSLFDDMLSLTMGTTGTLVELRTIISKDETIDELDDKRREKYITTIFEFIKELEEFANKFNDPLFFKWVKKHIKFFNEDLENQLFYEELSDKARELLINKIDTRTNKLKDENEILDLTMIETSRKKRLSVG